MPGDISQLQFREGSGFAHSQIIVSTGNPPAPENILTASHSMDRDYYPIGDYSYARVRFIHILGVRNG